jgi:hypothetical protein
VTDTAYFDAILPSVSGIEVLELLEVERRALGQHL